MCKDGRHDFRKFDDSRIFCRDCGDVRVVAPAPIQWRPYPFYPTTTPWWYGTVNTVGITTTSLTNTTATQPERTD